MFEICISIACTQKHKNIVNAGHWVLGKKKKQSVITVKNISRKTQNITFIQK